MAHRHIVIPVQGVLPTFRRDQRVPGTQERPLFRRAATIHTRMAGCLTPRGTNTSVRRAVRRNVCPTGSLWVSVPHGLEPFDGRSTSADRPQHARPGHLLSVSVAVAASFGVSSTLDVRVRCGTGTIRRRSSHLSLIRTSIDALPVQNQAAALRADPRVPAGAHPLGVLVVGVLASARRPALPRVRREMHAVSCPQRCPSSSVLLPSSSAARACLQPSAAQ
jgi:hypothetical protein